MRLISLVKYWLFVALSSLGIFALLARCKLYLSDAKRTMGRNKLLVLFLVLFVQLIAIAYAMAFTLSSSTSETHETPNIIGADVDADGDIDYVSVHANGSSQTHQLYTNNGSAAFSMQTLFTHTNVTDACFADADLDGDADLLIVRNNGGTYVFQFYKNDGVGSFSSQQALTLLTLASFMGCGDMDQDGDIDVVVGSASTQTSGIILNDGKGVFATALSTIPPAIVDIKTADFSGDGVLDLLLSNGTNYIVMRNSGTGAFIPTATAAGSTYLMTTGDLDNDGDIDFIATNGTSARPYLNNGLGTSFTAGTAFGSHVDYDYNDLALGDVDNDGDFDVIVSTVYSVVSAGNEIWLNNGSAVFSLHSTAAETNDSTVSLVVGDLDSDGDLDYIAGEEGSTNPVGHRHYKNDQAATSTNTAPSAPSSGSLTGALVLPSPKNAATFADDSSIGTVLWTFTSSAQLSDDDHAHPGSMTVGQITHYLKVTNFGFSIPSNATILGMKVDVERSSLSPCVFIDNAVRIVKGGTIQSTDRSNGTSWPATDAYVSYGSTTDLWGATFTPSDINSSDFGFAISGQCTSASFGGGQIDHVRITVYYSMRDVTLSWGSGSDTETATRLLQYQVKLGTGSNTNNIVSGVTSSPNWVTRLMPNNKSRQYALKNLPCGNTFYWNVAAVDAGFKKTWSSEQTFTLTASCDFTSPSSGGSSTSSTSGGGGGAAWLILLRSRKESTNEEELGYGFLNFSAFEDMDGNGKQGNRETYGFADLPVTIEGNTIDGKKLKRTLFLREDGTLKVKIRESDALGYSILFNGKSSVVQDFLATKGILQTVVVKRGKTAPVSVGFQRKNLLRLLPCLQVGAERNNELPGSPAFTLLQRLTDIYGSPVSSGVDLEKPLMSRRDFLTLLQRTECVDLLPEAIIRNKLRASFAKHTIAGWNTMELLDLPLSPYTSDAKLVYSLLAQGIGVARSSSNGGIADLSSPISRREAILLAEAAMKIPVARRKTSGVTLPDDLRKTDPLVSSFQVLSYLGALPESFSPILGADQGLNTSEAPTLLVRSAFRAGRIDLLPPFGADTTEEKSFLSTLPSFTLPPCLETDTDRPSKISFTDALPGSELYDLVRPLLAYGIEGADRQTLWLLSGTPRLSEFGVEKAEITLRPGDPVSMLEVLRGLLILSCLPPESRASILTSNSNPFPIGSGESRIARDRLFGLLRNGTLASRLSYRSQDRIKEFDLSLFSFAPHLLSGEIRTPTDPLSLRDASELLSSSLLGILVKNEVLTTVEAEEKMQELRHALLEEFLGITVTERNDALGDKAALTREHFLRFLSSITQKGSEEGIDADEEIIQIDAGIVLHEAAPPLRASRSTVVQPSIGAEWWGKVQ